MQIIFIPLNAHKKTGGNMYYWFHLPQPISVISQEAYLKRFCFHLMSVHYNCVLNFCFAISHKTDMWNESVFHQVLYMTIHVGSNYGLCWFSTMVSADSTGFWSELLIQIIFLSLNGTQENRRFWISTGVSSLDMYFRYICREACMKHIFFHQVF